MLLTLFHGSAKEASHGLELKETDTQLFVQRISHAVVDIADEETEVLAGSGSCPRDFCAPRIFAKATCNAFTPALQRLKDWMSLEDVTRSDWNNAQSPEQHTVEYDGILWTTLCVTSSERGYEQPDAGRRIVPGFWDESPTNPEVPVARETLTAELVFHHLLA